MKFSDSHEWVLLDGNIATVGITDFGQEELGEIVYVELPKIGQVIDKNDTSCVIESTKAAVDISSPISGKVIKVNNALKETPSIINKKPLSDGWIYQVEVYDTKEFDELLLESEYKDIIS